ncbi:MAG: (Fe-S)-binding protein [Candidatus Eisenbacteria bacterium]|uniref:(Fe-S)-binding protein n=1 Tax=Eiseniibacteriota bacterium TaxID=2212470 RepID=A0A948RXG4_UNCEI|nr:(Fe-S)-binding protein [Candidatus Eisenbacteria bacterium]MBU1950376.1 (Fe-S)-binding protein [Candidatus Eisenbacteria bacterium]MBU2691756.1 (Fe-S)-binding protein [Candidatus Eisenbacteria bacterium]
MGKVLKVAARDQCIGCLSCMYSCSRTWHEALTTSKSAIRIRTYMGTEGAFSIRACRACTNPGCVAACPTGALTQRSNGALKLDAEKCTSCGDCVKACLIQALQWDDETKLPLPCSHCGVCVRYCPNEVLVMGERKEESRVEANS